MYQIGAIKIQTVSGGAFRLDGGGMFGIVPRMLWERVAPADERNRIRLETNCALVEVGGTCILIDTGNGTKLTDKDREIFAIDPMHMLTGALTAVGVAPEAIDIVLLTHLHLDHVGGGTLQEADGAIRPTFPRARYVAQRGEWEDGLANRSTMRTSYRRENLAPLQEAGLVELIDGDTEVAPGVRTWVTGGHTRHHQAILFESDGERGIYCGDILPTTAHIKGPYNMAYDLYPYETMQQKLQMMAQAAHENWLVLFDHDPDTPAVRLHDDGKGGYLFEAQYP